ncbi:hypothetical protein KP001_12235 [Geomonas subterranea]|uniref:Uncharacterized protein n=1 Tax=Geomonas subterranea TaxID=2847989 RepID=A0ABX8LFT0_9BACT|nr:hypothetical protein [Geomonas subterranea]QXE89229.1 hypothetical protein KP001_12235 [Geomonas subterranea]QXM08659.1 hypothetical protein KP002_17040 [Geomonas subterranea]
MRWVLLLSLIFVSASANAEEVWLVIGASDPTPAGIAQKAKRSGQDSGIIIQSRDCGDKSNVFVWAVKIEPSSKAAKETLETFHFPGAYIKKCQITQGSLLAFRENVVDRSIADVPATTVNWEDADRVSSIQPLQQTGHIVISRYYNGSVDDPLEGRRERVILIESSGARHLLQQECVNPEDFTTTGGLIAYQCVIGQAGDQLLHNVVVFAMDGKKLKEIRNCRNPKLPIKGSVACQRESVGADGALRLQIMNQFY